MNLDQKSKKIFSQNGEDGAIDYIFKKIGFKTKIFIEFGFGCFENNSRNLIKNFGFSGLFIDGNSRECEIAKSHYRSNIFIENAFITKENINQLISKHYTGDIDFLSIDIDGVDLHILDAIDAIHPRVVCIEYCASIGVDKSVTVPYKDDFSRHAEHRSGFYCGASLKANILVMKKKNFKFIGTVSGLNAFFVRDTEPIDEISLIEGYKPHFSRTYEDHPRFDGTIRKITPDEQFHIIKDLPWVNVSEEGLIGTNHHN